MKRILFVLPLLFGCSTPERKAIDPPNGGGSPGPLRLFKLADGRKLRCEVFFAGQMRDLRCEGDVYIYNAANFELAEPLPPPLR